MHKVWLIVCLAAYVLEASLRLLTTWAWVGALGEPSRHKIEMRSKSAIDELTVCTDHPQEYVRTGYVWEQYDPLTGAGQRRCVPLFLSTFCFSILFPVTFCFSILFAITFSVHRNVALLASCCPCVRASGSARTPTARLLVSNSEVGR